jgi:TBCC domain-containing protein 1
MQDFRLDFILVWDVVIAARKHGICRVHLRIELRDAILKNQVITAEQFEHLGLLLKAKNAELDSLPLSQAAPFFANSDPDMPAAPVPVAQVLEWVLQHVCAASENLRELPSAKDEKSGVKDNGPSENGIAESLSSEVADVTMADATTCTVGVTPQTQTIIIPNGILHLSKDWRPEGLTFVDGVTRCSVLKGENDIKGGSVKVALFYFVGYFE